MMEHHTRHHGVDLTIAHGQMFEVTKAELATVDIDTRRRPRQIEHGCRGVDGDDSVGALQQRRQQQTRPGAKVENCVAAFWQKGQRYLAVAGTFEGLMPQFVAVAAAVEEISGLLATALDGRFHALHVRLEMWQGTLVFAAQMQHVCDKFVLRIRAALIVDPRALTPARDQSRLGENAKMSGDPALSHAQNVDHFVDIER